MKYPGFTNKAEFLKWVDENTTMGKCASCGCDILQLPFGRKRVVCGVACSRAYREEQKMRGARICVTCGRSISNAQLEFIARRTKRYTNVPEWLREIEEDQRQKLSGT